MAKPVGPSSNRATQSTVVTVTAKERPSSEIEKKEVKAKNLLRLMKSLLLTLIFVKDGLMDLKKHINKQKSNLIESKMENDEMQRLCL